MKILWCVCVCLCQHIDFHWKPSESTHLGPHPRSSHSDRRYLFVLNKTAFFSGHLTFPQLSPYFRNASHAPGSAGPTLSPPRSEMVLEVKAPGCAGQPSKDIVYFSWFMHTSRCQGALKLNWWNCINNANWSVYIIPEKETTTQELQEDDHLGPACFAALIICIARGRVNLSCACFSILYIPQNLIRGIIVDSKKNTKRVAPDY